MRRMGSQRALYLVLFICICIFGVMYFKLTSDRIVMVSNKEMFDGSIYSGEMKKGMFHGNGILESFTGVIYEGEFSEGSFHGEGSLRFPNGSVLIGEFMGGLLVEKHKVIHSNGDVKTFINK